MRDLSRPGLFAPAAIQAPTPLQALSTAVTPMIKDNSDVASGFEHMKEIIAMTQCQGRYFEELKADEKQNFVQILSDLEVPPARMIRMTTKLKSLNLDEKSQAYDEFIKYIFDASKVSGKVN